MTEEERLKEFLLQIHMHQGKVCEEFETCQHVACKSNYATWELADAALRGLTLEQYRAENTRIQLLQHTSSDAAITLQCFKCGAYGVVAAPLPEEHPACKACQSLDVSIIETERMPNGFINNCALAAGYPEKDCQMCLRGPCPEGNKVRSAWAKTTR